MLSCPCSSADPGSGAGKSPLGDIIKSVIGKMGGKDKVGEEEIVGAWREAVGEAASKHSRPASLKKGSISVNVDGSAWLYELTLKKKEILEKLEEKIKGKKIKEIRFRIGEIKKAGP